MFIHYIICQHMVNHITETKYLLECAFNCFIVATLKCPNKICAYFYYILRCQMSVPLCAGLLCSSGSMESNIKGRHCEILIPCHTYISRHSVSLHDRIRNSSDMLAPTTIIHESPTQHINFETLVII